MDHIKINLTQLKTFELEFDFTEYSTITLMCGLRNLLAPIRHLPGNVISATVGFV